jgi:thiopurine S-methyltransferase
MEPSFWHDRWQKNSIGFHQERINSQLQEFWPQLGLSPNSAVFVPLCGKSRDIMWLHERGHEVLGVDISAIAARDFFAENKLNAKTTTRGRFEVWECGRLKILVGDFFELEASELAEVAGVYDRASLIALPPPMRARYAEHLASILPARAEILLVTLEYSPKEMHGPPFPVGEPEVRRLYEPRYLVTALQDKDVLDENPHLRERGLTTLTERAYRLSPMGKTRLVGVQAS